MSSIQISQLSFIFRRWKWCQYLRQSLTWNVPRKNTWEDKLGSIVYEYPLPQSYTVPGYCSLSICGQRLSYEEAQGPVLPSALRLNGGQEMEACKDKTGPDTSMLMDQL